MKEGSSAWLRAADGQAVFYSKSPTKGDPMKPIMRYRSQLLFRKSYKPNRVIRIRPVKLYFEFRPVRFGLKPQIKTRE
jgi:hypothetical protein